MQPGRKPSRIGEDRIREAIEHAASGIAITDLHGCFEETNAAYRQIVARDEAQLESESILSVTHEADREGCRRHLQDLTDGRCPSFVLEKRYIRPDGEAVWVRNSFSLLRDDSGLPTHIVLVCNDVTDRRRAERLLIESERLSLLGQLSSSIAHEINNPLESVLNLLYLASISDSLDEMRPLVARAEAEIRHVAEIAGSTLNFQKRQQTVASADIGEILSSVLSLFQAQMAKSRVHLELTVKASPNVLCYPGELRQVFANLIRNSIEAMPEGGKLCARVRPTTEWAAGSKGVRVTIVDTGCGMSEETRRHLFDPFFTTKGAAGNGLGLWITRVTLLKHRAAIRMRSSDAPLRRGTAAMMIFPTQGAEGRPAGIGAIGER